MQQKSIFSVYKDGIRGKQKFKYKYGYAVVVKVKKGYANTAKKKLQKSLTQTVDYNKLYNMDTIRVNQARISLKEIMLVCLFLEKKRMIS